MQRKFIKGKKRAVIGAGVAVVLAATAAFAYFTTLGSGTGGAQTGTAAHLTISEIGPGYDSLLPGVGTPTPSGPYSQDQCFQCAGVSEFGNEVNLSPGGRLTDVVVGMRNWGAAVSQLPVTLNLYKAPATLSAAETSGPGPLIWSVTSKIDVPAAQAGGSPTAFNAAFNWSPYDVTVNGPVVYGISFSSSAAPSLNVALSSSGSNLTVGTDALSGYVFVNTSTQAGWQSDAGTCGEPGPVVGHFTAVNVWCSDVPVQNYGAYGNSLNADIPAVEFNVVGGSPLLYPGVAAQPLDYAITNTGGPVHVGGVSASVPHDNFGNIESSGNPVSGCQASWYQVNGSPQTIGSVIPGGISFFDEASPVHSTLSIGMLDSGNPQDACQGKTVDLSFASN